MKICMDTTKGALPDFEKRVEGSAEGEGGYGTRQGNGHAVR